MEITSILPAGNNSVETCLLENVTVMIPYKKYTVWMILVLTWLLGGPLTWYTV